MAGLRIAGGTLLIIAGVGTIVLFFRPRKLRRMMRMNSRVYRESESRRELGDAVYQYTVFPRVMGVMWLGPFLVAIMLMAFGISLLS